MDDRRYDGLPGGSGPPRAKYKEQPPPKQDVRSLAARPFWRLAALYSLLLLHPPSRRGTTVSWTERVPPDGR
ncbi:hypothetical protein MTO96_019960 [Rhipicephalus appendiculatus]